MAVRSVVVAAVVSLAAAMLLSGVGILLIRGGAVGVGQLTALFTLLFAAGVFIGAFAGARSGVRAGAQPRHAVLGAVAGVFMLWFISLLLPGGNRAAMVLLGSFALTAVAAISGALLAVRTAGASHRDLDEARASSRRR